jgi:hypothetical protein
MSGFVASHGPWPVPGIQVKVLESTDVYVEFSPFFEYTLLYVFLIYCLVTPVAISILFLSPF